MKAKLALFEDEIIISFEIVSMEIIGVQGKSKIVTARFETSESFNDIIKKREPLLVIPDIKISDLNKKLANIINGRTIASLNKKEAKHGLSRREKEILALLVDGLTKQRIADKLSLSFHTVDSHLRNIYKKLKVKSKSQAVAKSINEGLL